MKRVIIGFFMLMIMSGSLSAQTMMNGLMDEFRFKKITEGTYAGNSLKLSDISGTPFLDEDFNPGKITTQDNVIYTEIPLRYNGYTDDLEFRKGEDSYNIDPKTSVKRAEFGGRTFTCLSFDDGKKLKNGFFEILTDGKAILLVKYTVKFVEKDQVKAFAEPKPARFDPALKEYYIAIDNGPAQLISNKKGLLEMFGDKKGSMESYISKNKIPVRGDDALTKIVVHYNSL